jgi:SAM-dependent methyltransferase
MFDYPFGHSKEEFKRLKNQHVFWSSRVQDHWEAARLTKEDIVLDAGCGPGFATIDFAKNTTHVYAADNDQASLDFVERTAIKLGLKNITAFQASDILDTKPVFLQDLLPTVVYLRWVLMYLGVERTKRALNELTAHVQKGTRLLIQDYLNYRSARLFPRSKAMDKAVQGFYQSMVESGCDPDIGFSLPGILNDIGFEIVWSRVVPILAISGSNEWEWPDEFFRLHTEKLKEEGHLSRGTYRQAMEDWDRASHDQSSSFYAWPTLQLVAYKR